MTELPAGWKINRIAGRRVRVNPRTGRWTRSWDYKVVDERGICRAVEERRNDAIVEALKDLDREESEMPEHNDGLSLLIALFEGYFATNDWTPNCDECGDDGCEVCDFGRLYNHRPPHVPEPFYTEDHLGKW